MFGLLKRQKFCPLSLIFVHTARSCGRKTIAAVTLRAHTSDPAATFVLLLRVHLFWLHSLIRVRFVIKSGILERSLTEIICAHFCSTLPHPPSHSTYRLKVYVQCEWDRQTDRQVSRTLLPDEVNPSIIQLVHRSIISCHLPSLLPTHPHAPSHPSLFPHFPLPSLSMLLPLTPHSSREVQSGPTCTIHVTNPKQSSTAPGVSNKWCCQQLTVLCWRLDRTVQTVRNDPCFTQKFKWFTSIRAHDLTINECDDNMCRQETDFCGIKPVHYGTNPPDRTVSHSRRSSTPRSAFLHWHVTFPQITFIWRCFLNSIRDTKKNKRIVITGDVTEVVAYFKVPE